MTETPTPPASGGRSAAAGNSSGVIATGDQVRIEQRNVVLPPGALQAAVPDDSIARLNNLPEPDSRVFEGRNEALAALRDLPSMGTGIVTQTVRGMGGVGKSTLVLHHAHACLTAGHGPVWWINAASTATITAGLASLATVIDPLHAALPLDEAADWAVAWLQGRTGWLLVFDNAEEPADLHAYLGRLSTGQTLVTTRRDLPWRDLGTPLCLDTLTPDASLKVLQEITGRRADRDAAELIELAEELGNLPLALQQAGAYLAQTRTTAASYLTQVRADPAGVLATAPPGDSQQRAIAQLWSVTFSAVHAEDRHAVELLRTLAYCAPDPLPRRVLTTALPAIRDVDHALGVLAAYSLITLTDLTVTVHRLVQTVLRCTTPAPAPRLQSRGIRRLLRRTRPLTPQHSSETALNLLHAAMPSGSPEDVQSWPEWQELLPHVEAVNTHCHGTETISNLAELLGQTAFYLTARGQAAQALPLEERALAITEATLGPDHRDTALRLGNLAGTFSDLGRHAEALPLEERALGITEAVLGPDHPVTAIRLNNLASMFNALGRHAEALPLAERALAITENALGPDHPTTALRLGNLASTFSDLGRHTEALPLEERALGITEAALGPDHPTTAIRLNNLASMFSDLGRHAEALPLAERALGITEAVLGSDHPDTALRLGNLARTFNALGRHAEALPLVERALGITEAALGSDHPDTALRLGNLARTFNALGRYAEALPLVERALGITEAALGSDHPTTAIRLGNLARTFNALGRRDEALPLEERALGITEAALGPDHPTTAIRLGNLARTFNALGRRDEALPLEERALGITEAALGPDHPTTAIRLGNLASTFNALGRRDEALPLVERALGITEAALGPDHPTTAIRLGNLASTFNALGRHAEALPLVERALGITEAALGPDHPTTAIRLNNLASTFNALGRHAEALPLVERALAITEAALGPDHPDTAHCLDNLSAIRAALEDLTRDEP
ncbi:FxSxx-COOH system tetratricopeptide repeat protein [Streptomyces sp. NBC_00659]|uniref:FxSxx-COOH system tetratricopeptide repeat protein n=1 Tax=Streptomyces sp. NBC_00659 TaxID=2903669 RepID=UPI002E36CCBF|nr:FxSxx-COOH system tetratricopeptide repeat protein [Streptomyces sp. NBC_00659]